MKKRAILCVDDEEFILQVITEELAHYLGEGYIYETATNGVEALALVDKMVMEGIDVLVIISDWLMPGMKGDEFLTKVHQKYPQISKIMVTGQADEEAIKNAQKSANLKACLSRPWSSKDLVALINDSLGPIAN